MYAIPSKGTSAYNSYVRAVSSTSRSTGSASGRTGKFGNSPTVPPIGTSAYKAYARASSSAPFTSVPEKLFGALPSSPVIPSVGASSVSPVDVSSAYYDSIGDSSAKTVSYIDADLARQYNMSAETAYQEALSNTAYRRAVNDMQAAGLNPAALFGAGRVSGASGVSFVTPIVPDDSGSSGSSGYSGAGYSRSSAKRAYAFSNAGYNLIKAAGAGIGYLATKRYYGAYAGASAATQLMRIVNGLWQRK